MVRNVREGFFDKMQRLPLAFFDTRPHGDIMSRLTNDVDAVSVTVSQSAVQLMSGVVVVAGTLTIMFSLNPVMAVASLLPVPLVFALTASISRRTRRLFKAQQNALGALERAHRGDRLGNPGGEGFRPGGARAARGLPRSTRSCAGTARAPRSGRDFSCR